VPPGCSAGSSMTPILSRPVGGAAVATATAVPELAVAGRGRNSLAGPPTEASRPTAPWSARCVLRSCPCLLRLRLVRVSASRA
jgi:hypothetical protein